MRKEIDRLENELKMVSYNLTKGEQLEAILNSTFKEMEDITDVHNTGLTQFEISQVAGRLTGVLAVTDENLAVLARNALQ